MQKNNVLLAAALAGFTLASGQVFAGESPAKKDAGAGKAVEGECHGINACKGQGACGGKTHSCAGKNECKGQGWLKTTEKECAEKKGTFKKA